MGNIESSIELENIQENQPFSVEKEKHRTIIMDVMRLNKRAFDAYF